MDATRKVKQNQWGNWNGYIGTKRAVEFGCDDVSAGYWLETGIFDVYEGYSNIAHYRELAFKGKITNV